VVDRAPEPSLVYWFTAQTIASRPDIIDRVSKTLLCMNPTCYAAMWDIIAAFETRERLPAIRCPVLVLVGEQDGNTPPEAAAQLAGAIPQATLVVLPQASHILPVDAPGAMAEEVLRFMAAA
jgi:3-oxoadipate enol-lactonase